MGIPRWCYQASMRLRALFRGAALDQDLDEELRFHVDRLVDANVARGLTPDAARREALLAVGGIEQLKEECRDTRGVRVIQDLLQDLNYALRTLRRTPAFTTAAILTLTLGIGATVAMFTVVHGVLVRPLPFPEPERLHLVSLSPKAMLLPQPGMVDVTFVAFRQADHMFQNLAAFTTYRGNLTGAGDPAVIQVGQVTTEFFDALAVKPARGRTFLPDDGQPGREPAVVIGDQLWRARFGSDDAVLGQSITLNGERRTVVGVMPAEFDFPAGAVAWTPHVIKLGTGNALMFPVLGRLKPGITAAQASAAFDAVIDTLPDVPSRHERSSWNVGILPLKELLVGDIRWPLQIFAGAVLLVLLVACANVANLLLARGSGRQREIAVRAALGAGRPRLVRQLLTESALLSLIGAALGLLAARWAVPMLLALAPEGRIPRTDMIRINASVIVFAIIVAATTGVIFGLAPALRLTRRRFAGPLLPGGRSAVPGQERFRAALVVGQIALALVLLTGAGLMARSFLRLRAVDPGFHTGNVVRLSVELPRAVYATPDRLHAFHRNMLERLSALPDVVAAGCVNWLPLGDLYLHGDFRIAGRPGKPGFDGDKPALSPGYFRAMGIRLLRGREFTEQDDASSLGVVIVSRSVARAIDPSEDVLGTQVNLWTSAKPEVWRTIVGVVDDIKQLGPTQKSHPAIYQPYPQVPRPFLLSTMTYVVRTGSDPLAIVPAMRSVLRAVDRDQPATAIGLLAESLDRHTSEPGFYAKLLGVFSLVAILLAVVGTYGVIAYGVAQRHHEIGVRMALGARDASVLWLVIRGTLVLAAAGVAVGTGVAWLATRFLKTVLFEITPTDPATFAAVAVTVFVAALIAGLVPARRATRVDPLVALRHE